MATTEKYLINKDIRVLCISAAFPNGVMSAHQKLHALFPEKERMFYGISWSDGKGGIIYKAAAEELQKADRDKGGHRVQALNLTQQAITHVQAGIQYDNTHRTKGEKKYKK